VNHTLNSKHVPHRKKLVSAFKFFANRIDYTRWIDASCAVNMSTLVLDGMGIGRAFQRRIGKERIAMVRSSRL
jgi:hypothetical protein